MQYSKTGIRAQSMCIKMELDISIRQRIELYLHSSSEFSYRSDKLRQIFALRSEDLSMTKMEPKEITQTRQYQKN